MKSTILLSKVKFVFPIADKFYIKYIHLVCQELQIADTTRHPASCKIYHNSATRHRDAPCADHDGTRCFLRTLRRRLARLQCYLV